MILTGEQIKIEVEAGNIHIYPYDEKMVNTNSVDLHLGASYAVYDEWVYCPLKPTMKPRLCVLSVDKPAKLHVGAIPEDGLVLQPGILYLMHTLEFVHAHHHVPVVDGKSSVGRYGISIHQTAGFGDTGFDGQYTLEVTCIHPVRIFANMRFCQIRFHETRGAVTDYKSTGHYVGSAAAGPVASKAHEQFKEAK